jgi:hypothetical protein
MKRDRVVAAAIALAFLLAMGALTKTKPESWNDIARVATIESLVERGTWAIDDSPWADLTQDKVLLNGKFYSDKLPLLPFLHAGAYAVLHSLGGSLAPNCESSRFCAYLWLTRISIGIPVALVIALFFDFARRQDIPLWLALIGALALGLGTMIFPYALVLTSHAIAGACLFFAFYILATRAPEDRKTLAAAGVLAALAASFDFPAAIIALGAAGIALVRARSRAIYFLVGAAIPIAVTLLLDYQIAQTILPTYLIPEGYDYPGSAFPAVFGGNAGYPDDYARYAFRMFLGGKGLFAYNPLLLFALIGAVMVALSRKHPLRVEAFFAAASFVALSFYLALGTGNFGGTSYGERWFVPGIPILFAFIFFAPPLNARAWKSAAWILFAPALALSIFSTLQGAQAPWQDWLPPLQMTRADQFPIFGFKWNVQFP